AAAGVAVGAGECAAPSAGADHPPRAGASGAGPRPADAIARGAFWVLAGGGGGRAPPRLGASRSARPAGGRPGLPARGASSFTGEWDSGSMGISMIKEVEIQVTLSIRETSRAYSPAREGGGSGVESPSARDHGGRAG